MKMKSYFFVVLTAMGAYLLTAFGGDLNSDYPSGSPAGYTGSPGDGNDCTSCHGGSTVNVTGWITSDVPASGYTAGSTYNITVTATGSGWKGFEVSPQNVSGTQLGTLIAGSTSHLTGGTKYVTHNARLNTNPATWTFQWQAPAAGTGQVTLYGAIVCPKTTTHLCTLVVPENAAAPLSVTATATPSSICAGLTSQLNALTAGGSGSYTYTWTSTPAGFTSTLKNPTVTPSQTTAYHVQVSDGTSTANSSATVTVTPAPTASAGTDTTYCDRITQFPVVGTASGYSSVSWTTTGDGSFSNATSLSTTYFPGPGDKSAGNVELHLAASPVSPCASAATSLRHVTFDPCTGIAGSGKASLTLKIQPNPAEDWIIVSLTGMNNSLATITLYDALGNTHFRENMISDQGEIAKTIDVSSFPAGLYFLKVVSGDQQTVTKVFIR